MNFLEPIDVILRVLDRKRQWFHGKPRVTIRGQEKSFGCLDFDFQDEIISIRIWLYDKSKILGIAQTAIRNFDQLWDDWIDLTWDKPI